MKSNLVIQKNESDANVTVAKVLRITFYLFTLILILNIVGIFIIQKKLMYSAYISSAILLLLPTVLNKIFGPDKKCLKFLYVTFSAIYIYIISATLIYHVLIVYAFPVAIAGIYFSRRLTAISAMETIIATIAGQYSAFFFNTFRDSNFKTLYELSIYGVLPRLICMISFGSLLFLLTSKTSKLVRTEAASYQKLLSHNKDMIYGFATLVENKDQNTGGHIKRTSIYVRMLSEQLKERGLYQDVVDETFIDNISQAAPLHDIGKIAIPETILQKPGKLTPEEYDIMKTHAEKGGSIIQETFYNLDNINLKTMSYEVARYHHEKWNGKGYPEGRAETNIPLAARIMSVADVFDAVSEERCYRDAMPLERCFEIIQEGRDKDFDPILVDCFMELKEQIIKVHEQYAKKTNA